MIASSTVRPAFYAASGKVPPAAFVAVPLLGVLAAIVAGGIYGVLAELNPFVYVTFFGAIIASGGAGLAVMGVGMAMHVRNTVFLAACGLLAGLFVLWSSWVTYVWALTSFEVVPLDPIGLMFGIFALTEEGVWTVKSFTPTGVVLLGIWGIEALILVLPAVAIAAGNNNPYCESSGSWAEEHKDARRLAGDPDAEALVRAAITQGTFHDVLALPPLPVGADQERALALDVHVDPTGGEESWLTVRVVTVGQDEKGKAKVETTDLFRNVVVPRAVANQLIA